MGKVWTYITITIGLTFILKLGGIPTGIDWILTLVGFNTTGTAVNNSLFYAAIIALFAVSTGASIVIGAFGRSAPEYALLAPFASANLVVFLSTFVAVINYTSSFENWFRYPILVVFGVLAVGFIFALVEWVFGRES